MSAANHNKGTNPHKKETSLALIILHDILIFLSTLIFGGWILIKLHNNMGVRFINLLNLAVTSVFSLLFLIKIIFLNRPGASLERSKKIKFVFKIIKYTLKLLLLATIILGLVILFRTEGPSWSAIASAIVANSFFLMLLIFDTFMIIRAQKKKRLEKENVSTS